MSDFHKCIHRSYICDWLYETLLCSHTNFRTKSRNSLTVLCDDIKVCILLIK